jgi:hypothetical protein
LSRSRGSTVTSPPGSCSRLPTEADSAIIHTLGGVLKNSDDKREKEKAGEAPNYPGCPDYIGASPLRHCDSFPQPDVLRRATWRSSVPDSQNVGLPTGC